MRTTLAGGEGYCVHLQTVRRQIDGHAALAHAPVWKGAKRTCLVQRWMTFTSSVIRRGKTYVYTVSSCGDFEAGVVLPKRSSAVRVLRRRERWQVDGGPSCRGGATGTPRALLGCKLCSRWDGKEGLAGTGRCALRCVAHGGGVLLRGEAGCKWKVSSGWQASSKECL